jgi:hypothetical protein
VCENWVLLDTKERQAASGKRRTTYFEFTGADAHHQKDAGGQGQRLGDDTQGMDTQNECF